MRRVTEFLNKVNELLSGETFENLEKKTKAGDL